MNSLRSAPGSLHSSLRSNHCPCRTRSLFHYVHYVYEGCGSPPLPPRMPDNTRTIEFPAFKRSDVFFNSSRTWHFCMDAFFTRSQTTCFGEDAQNHFLSRFGRRLTSEAIFIHFSMVFVARSRGTLAATTIPEARAANCLLYTSPSPRD